MDPELAPLSYRFFPKKMEREGGEGEKEERKGGREGGKEGGERE